MLGKIKKSTLFIILLGIVSLFGDFTYEGARSIIPQYFTITLGGSVFLLGIVIGLGDFIGYAFRLVSGKVADKTHEYWKITFLGYAINLFAVPLLALSGNYIFAIFLIFAERLGKATRAPAKDYIVSTAAEEGKVGRAFAINQALDQTGAIIGPLAVSLILLYTNGSYHYAFALLALPAVAAMIFLTAAHSYHKNVGIKPREEVKRNMMSFPRFLIYSAAVAVSTAGLYQVAFILVGAQGRISTYLIPLVFLTAMLGEGIFALVFGLLYDRIGRKLVYSGLALALAVPFLLLGQSPIYLFVAALVFGAVTGIQDTVMRAVVGSLIPKKERGFAYGIFNAFYGFGLMASGIVVGYLFYSLNSVMIYVAVAQAAALVLLTISFSEDAN